jgi:hypothetical protein
MEKERRESEELSGIDVVAYDEAGHVIVAYVLKRQIFGVEFELNPKGTYNACTYRDPLPYDPRPDDDLLPPYIDPNVPYDQMTISLQDRVSILGVISAAGKAGVTLLCRQKGVSEHLATIGMRDARQIISLLRKENVPLYERKRRFRDFENLALHIVSWPICKVALEQVADLFREKMLHPQHDERNGFTVSGLELTRMIVSAFIKGRDV